MNSTRTMDAFIKHAAPLRLRGWTVTRRANDSIEVETGSQFWPLAMLALVPLVFTLYIVGLALSGHAPGAAPSADSLAVAAIMASASAAILAAIWLCATARITCAIDASALRVTTRLGIWSWTWSEEKAALSSIRMVLHRFSRGPQFTYFIVGRASHALSMHVGWRKAEALARLIGDWAGVPVSGLGKAESRPIRTQA